MDICNRKDLFTSIHTRYQVWQSYDVIKLIWYKSHLYDVIMASCDIREGWKWLGFWNFDFFLENHCRCTNTNMSKVKFIDSLGFWFHVINQHQDRLFYIKQDWSGFGYRFKSQWWIQDFPDRGRLPQGERQPIIRSNFPNNCIKMKRNWTDPLDPPTTMVASWSITQEVASSNPFDEYF